MRKDFLEKIILYQDYFVPLHCKQEKIILIQE